MRPTVVVTCDTYGETQGTVRTLAEQGFPVERLAIVARDLRFLEKGSTTGAWRRTLETAIAGAVIGLLLGLIFMLFGWTDPGMSGTALVLGSYAAGAALGVVFGLVAVHGPGESSSASTLSLAATTYQVLADDGELARAARELLGRRHEAPPPPARLRPGARSA